jgi:hypothetical protein
MATINQKAGHSKPSEQKQKDEVYEVYHELQITEHRELKVKRRIMKIHPGGINILLRLLTHRFFIISTFQMLQDKLIVIINQMEAQRRIRVLNCSQEDKNCHADTTKPEVEDSIIPIIEIRL